MYSKSNKERKDNQISCTFAVSNTLNEKDMKKLAICITLIAVILTGCNGDEKAAQAGVQALTEFIVACGLPTRLSQLRSKAEITPQLLRQVADSTNLLPNGYKQLTHDEVYEILMECV